MNKNNQRILYIIGSNKYYSYKIGTTNDLNKRLRTISTLIPFEISVIDYIKGNTDYINKLENKLHHKYVDCQADARNEWFVFDRRTIKEINSYLLNIKN